MAKIFFTHNVKYDSVWHSANEPFEVPDRDVEFLIKDGAVVVEDKKIEEVKEPKKVKEVKEVKEEKVVEKNEVKEKKTTRKRGK